MIATLGRLATGSACALIGLLGLVSHPTPVLIGWLVATLLVSPFTAMSRHSARSRGGNDHFRAGVTATLATIGGVAVLAGLIAVLGIAVGLLVATLVGAWILFRFRAGAHTAADAFHPRVQHTQGAASSPPAAEVAGRAAVLVGPPHLASTAQLCVAWQRSFWRLRKLSPSEPHTEVIDLCRALLDELQRRDPDEFARWLCTDPRANSDPGRFFTTRR